MKRTRNHTGVLPVVILAFTILCTGCASHKFDADEYRVAIGYTYDQSIASPQQQVLFQNDDKTVTYQVTYLPDTTAEDAAAKFETNAEKATKVKTTWEQAIWEYHRFCQENSPKSVMGDVRFPSPEWDLTLWKFTADNSENASTTETLFCDRADGCYSIAMTYPTKDTAAKIALYTIVEDLSFQADIDYIHKIESEIDFVWGINENGELVITATNNGAEPAENVRCTVDKTKTDEDVNEQQGGFYSFTGEELLPGETTTFTVSAEYMKDAMDYSVEPSVYYSIRMIDSEGTVCNLE